MSETTASTANAMGLFPRISYGQGSYYKKSIAGVWSYLLHWPPILPNLHDEEFWKTVRGGIVLRLYRKRT